MTQKKISKAQIVEGKRLILEPIEDVEALAGSLRKGKWKHSVDALKAAGRKGMTEAGALGLKGKSMV